MVIRDVMPAFELLQPASAADAQKLLEAYGSDAWILAGGLDSFDWLKDRIRKPKVVVDLSGIEELRGVRSSGDGLEIGAMTTLAEVSGHPIIREKYGVLAQAAGLVASPSRLIRPGYKKGAHPRSRQPCPANAGPEPGSGQSFEVRDVSSRVSFRSRTRFSPCAPAGTLWRLGERGYLGGDSTSLDATQRLWGPNRANSGVHLNSLACGMPFR
jgi:hypothetical protein